MSGYDDRMEEFETAERTLHMSALLVNAMTAVENYGQLLDAYIEAASVAAETDLEQEGHVQQGRIETIIALLDIEIRR